MNDKEFYTVRGYQLLDQHQKVLSPSLEDYLEMIYREIKKNGYIRISTLANELNVKPSSASKMVSRLSSLGFVEYEKYGVIHLTEHGNEIGKYLLWRHDTLYQFLHFISQDESSRAFVETELIEHILSKKTVENIHRLLKFFMENEDICKQFKEIT